MDMKNCEFWFVVGSQFLYVMQPDMASVSEITEKMQQVLAGQ